MSHSFLNVDIDTQIYIFNSLKSSSPKNSLIKDRWKMQSIKKKYNHSYPLENKIVKRSADIKTV